jgi:hypothetical protein
MSCCYTKCSHAAAPWVTLHFRSPVLWRAVACCAHPAAAAAAGDVDDEYLAELESTGRGASRTRAGRKTSLVQNVAVAR